MATAKKKYLQAEQGRQPFKALAHPARIAIQILAAQNECIAAKLWMCCPWPLTVYATLEELKNRLINGTVDGTKAVIALT